MNSEQALELMPDNAHLEIVKLREMLQPKPIASAPQDRMILLYGKLHTNDKREMVAILKTNAYWHVGYWDWIDNSWCTQDATWTGPFIEATHWCELPNNPTNSTT